MKRFTQKSIFLLLTLIFCGCSYTETKETVYILIPVAILIAIIIFILYIPNLINSAHTSILKISENVSEKLYTTITKTKYDIENINTDIELLIKKISNENTANISNIKETTQDLLNSSKRLNDRQPEILQKMQLLINELDNRRIEQETFNNQIFTIKQHQIEINKLDFEIDKLNSKLESIERKNLELKLHNDYLQEKLTKYNIDFSSEYEVLIYKKKWRSYIADGKIERVLDEIMDIKLNLSQDILNDATLYRSQWSILNSSRDKGTIKMTEGIDLNRIIEAVTSLVEKI